MRYITLLASTSLALSLNAQWSLDANTPMIVCDAPNAQRFTRAIADGGSGWFVFWSDLRNDPQKAELFGQHFDAAGVAQWTANGEPILALPGRSVNEIAPVLLDDGDVILAVLSSANNTSNADTVRAIRLDPNGQQVWSNPALLSVNGPGIFGNCFYFSAPNGIKSGDGAFFCYRGDSQGSNGYYAMQRVRGDGSVAFGVPGLQVPYNAGFGPFEVQPDGAGGMLVAWRCSNGAGTCHRAMRVDSLGAAQWAANFDVAAGGAGLAYAFTTAADGAGAFVSVWEESGGDLGMARFDTTGSHLWTPSPFHACTESHTQSTPALAFSGGDLYVAWSDNRPPASNHDLYMQKIDPVTGALLWATDGVLVVHTNSYIPTARIVPAIDGAIGIMDFGGTEKYCAMRMNSDGTPAWAVPTSFATANLPFYEERVELADGAGGAVSFWQTQNGDLYGARIHANGELGDHTGLDEAAAMLRMNVYPDPARTMLYIDGPIGLHAARVRDVNGRLCAPVRATDGSRIALDVSALTPGVYFVEVTTDAATTFVRFLKE